MFYLSVHPTDMARLDLTIPGEQYYYVKASSPQDRQSWLIALGSSKAAFSETTVAKKSAGKINISFYILNYQIDR
jgi:hypothetical protein